MIIEQMIEVPDSRLITIKVPPQIPVGKARILFTPLEEPQEKKILLLSMRGSCKGFDTLDAYFTRKRTEKAKEDHKDNYLSGKT